MIWNKFTIAVVLHKKNVKKSCTNANHYVKKAWKKL